MKKPLYIFFSKSFIDHFMRTNKYHNSEFASGDFLLNKVNSYKEGSVEIFSNYYYTQINNGLVICKKDENLSEGIIIDKENYVNNNFWEKDTLQIFSKVFRLYIKYMNNYPMSIFESHIAQSDEYLVNPFQYSTKNVFRILLNRNPDKKRSSKRNFDISLNTGDGSGTLKRDNYSLKNYRKYLDSIEAIKKIISGFKEPEEINEEKYYDLSKEKNKDEIINYIGFDKWFNYLSSTQKKFVLSDTLGPLKISGAAGSGKTLSMILKIINITRKYESNGESIRIGVICHSNAVKDNVLAALSIDAKDFLSTENDISIEVCTLLEWSIKYAVKDFEQADCLEVDSEDSKIMQLMMVESAIQKFKKNIYSTYEPLLSEKFKSFFNGTDNYNISEMIRSEISLFIKGCNIDSFDTYKNCAQKDKIIPWNNENDLSAIYRLYTMYQENLEAIGKYDLDDVTSVASAFLGRQIWKRTRKTLGYDVVFVDEIHLYDFSELCLIPYMLIDQTSNHIISTVDVSQSTRDMNLINANLEKFFNDSVSNDNLKLIFRSSEPIINLASFIFERNISLFSSVNPIEDSNVISDELNEEIPILYESLNDKDMISSLISAGNFKKFNDKSEIIVVTDLALIDMINDQFSKNRIKTCVMTKRGDINLLKQAKKENRKIVSYIDYVGGLEFDTVYFVGLDNDRLPPINNAVSNEFNEHLWYRKLYVSLTRARKSLRIFTNISNSLHPFLAESLKKGLVEKSEI